MTSWTERPIWGFDLETTGTDPRQARIVSAALVRVPASAATHAVTWLADPGVVIPDAARAVHGISTEHAQSHGRTRREVVAEIVARLDGAWAVGEPVAGHQLNYDLSVLAFECERLGFAPLVVRGPVLDSLLLDMGATEPTPVGSRSLSATCRRYGVALPHPHQADSDARAAAQLVAAIGRRHVQQLGGRELSTLVQQQQRWHQRRVEVLLDQPADGSPRSVIADWPLLRTSGTQARKPWRPTIWQQPPTDPLG